MTPISPEDPGTPSNGGLPERKQLSLREPSVVSRELPREAISLSLTTQRETFPSSGADHQEVDVWWGAYSGRTMAPVFLGLGVVTLLIAFLAWQLLQENSTYPQAIWHAFLGLIILLWLAPLYLWVSRCVGYNFRLTTYRLFRDLGVDRRAASEVPLTHIQSIKVEWFFWERWLKVGRVCVSVDGQARLILEGVCDPNQVAAKILWYTNRIREAEGKPPIPTPPG